MPGPITNDQKRSKSPSASACEPGKAHVIQHSGPEPALDGLENAAQQLRAMLNQADGQWRGAMHLLESMQQRLQKNTHELEICSRRLHEASTALKLILAGHEEERHASEERVVCNINEQIRPHFSKLMGSKLNRQQRALLDAIAKSLDDITSPLSRRFTLESSRLSPVQIRVAGMIRQGRTTKEIAAILGVAASTVDFHRHNIRRKLNLINSRTNLQTYLQSLA